MASVIYIGDLNENSTSRHRADALIKLGHQVAMFNPRDSIAKILKIKLLGVFHYRTGYRFLQRRVNQWLLNVLTQNSVPDLIWVNSGEFLGVNCLLQLKKIGVPVILYNNDDPTGDRDKGRFGSLLKAIPYYDLCVVRRRENIDEYKERGAKKVICLTMSYDEDLHKPFNNIADIRPQFRSEVAFIGTWMRKEKRDEFILELLAANVPVSIWGDRWDKSPYFTQLKQYWRGPAIYGREYVEGIQGAKICLGLLSKGNRDLHTRRSVEVPFIGSVLCAERTSEHELMYKDNDEAVFWSSAKECAEICNRLLKDDEKREQIRLAGMKRVRELGAGNQDIGKKVLQAVFAV